MDISREYRASRGTGGDIIICLLFLQTTKTENDIFSAFVSPRLTIILSRIDLWFRLYVVP